MPKKYFAAVIVFLLIAFQLNALRQKPEINHTDVNGLKQGLWRKTDEGKRLVYEGQFKDDIPQGEFRHYYPNGHISVVIMYENNGLNAQATFRHLNGRTKSEGAFVDQEREGLWRFFNEDGNLVSEEHYRNGLKHGISKNYYPNGALLEKQHYIEGIKNGTWEQYYPNGTLKHKANFENDLLDGAAYYYYQNGQIINSGVYKSGLRHGEWVRYNEHGEKETVESWETGVLMNDQKE